ncbi:uncharacterized protein LOC143286437 [Babylonia areolata]|uniref:uncharacterized protein LOC143286437 n=1 Tax=Babylonia areolata TaxID=304850 RepID=UPI003FD2CDA9
MWISFISWSSYVVILSVIPLSGGLRLAGCSGDNDAIELIEHQSRQKTVCENIDQNEQLQWLFGIHNGAFGVLSNCSRPNQPCDNRLAATMQATRGSTTSTLTFVSAATRPGGNTATYSGFDVGCRYVGGGSSNTSTCPVDTVYPPSPPSEVSCNVSIDTRWNVTVSCDISKAYSSLNRYRCAFRQDNSSEETRVGESRYSSAASTNYTSGTCTSTFPMPTSRGVYNYSVIVYPGVRRVSASPHVLVEPPDTSPAFHCYTLNGYVPKSTTLVCTCNSPDLGQPEGRLQVYHGDTLLVSGNYGDGRVAFEESHHASSADNETVFTCVLDWATADDGDRRTFFTVKAAWENGSMWTTDATVVPVDVSTPEDDGWKIGVGVGVGLGVLVLIAIAVGVSFMHRGKIRPASVV